MAGVRGTTSEINDLWLFWRKIIKRGGYENHTEISPLAIIRTEGAKGQDRLIHDQEKQDRQKKSENGHLITRNQSRSRRFVKRWANIGQKWIGRQERQSSKEGTIDPPSL